MDKLGRTGGGGMEEPVPGPAATSAKDPNRASAKGLGGYFVYRSVRYGEVWKTNIADERHFQSSVSSGDMDARAR